MEQSYLHIYVILRNVLWKKSWGWQVILYMTWAVLIFPISTRVVFGPTTGFWQFSFLFYLGNLVHFKLTLHFRWSGGGNALWEVAGSTGEGIGTIKRGTKKVGKSSFRLEAKTGLAEHGPCHFSLYWHGLCWSIYAILSNVLWKKSRRRQVIFYTTLVVLIYPISTQALFGPITAFWRFFLFTLS